MGWPFAGLKKKMVEKGQALEEAAPAEEAPPVKVSPPVDEVAKEKKYQDELKGLRLRMGYGTITKEQYDQQSEDLNKRYGK